MKGTIGARAILAAVALLAAFAASGQERQVFRYTDPDGRIVYTDRPPPGEVKGVQQKRLGGNYIETSEPSVAMRQASERFPLTLYTFTCGEPCDTAEAFLSGRGLPFTKVNVEEAQGRKKLQELIGELTVPVLQVGDKQVGKGFDEARWQAMLDEAGYPKGAVRRPVAKAPEPAPAPEPQARSDAAPRGPNVMVIPNAPTGYPK